MNTQIIQKILRRWKSITIAFSVKRKKKIFGFSQRQIRIKRSHIFANGAKVLVVGSSGFIGEAITDLLLERGCQVIGTFNKSQPVHRVGANFFPIRLDVTDMSSLAEGKKYIVEEFSDLDLIVIASGIMPTQEFNVSVNDELCIDEIGTELQGFIDAFHTNTLGPFVVVRWFVSLLKRKSSRADISPVICILTSSLGTMHNEIYGGRYAYRTSKGALHSLMMAAYCDLRKSLDFSLIMMGPGNVKSSMNTFGILSPKESAQEILKSLEYTGRTSKICFRRNKRSLCSMVIKA